MNEWNEFTCVVCRKVFYDREEARKHFKTHKLHLRALKKQLQREHRGVMSLFRIGHGGNNIIRTVKKEEKKGEMINPQNQQG